LSFIFYLGKFTDIEYARGCGISSHSERDFNAAIELDESSHVVFILGGIDHTIERKGEDRISIGLPDDNVVLAYVTLPSMGDDEIVLFKELFGSERVHLAVNETKEVFFSFTIARTVCVARDGTKSLHLELYYIPIGQQRRLAIESKEQSTQWV
jgi:hypothetical protein